MSISPTLSQLRAVVAVADHLSFSRAAETLLLAQSSLSRTVAEVERSCGVTLFERTTRRVEPTADGRAFVQTARLILESYEENLAHFRGHLDGTRSLFRIAALPSLAAVLLPALVTRFRALLPEVEVEVEDALADEVVERVRGGAVDLGLTAATSGLGGPDSATRDAEVAFEVVATDDFRFVAAPDHPLVDRDAVSWSDFESASFIAFDAPSSVRHLTDEVLGSRAIRPARHLTARSVATVGGLCAAGLGVTAVPAMVLPLMSFSDLATRPLVGPRVTRQIGVLRDPRRQPSRAARAFVEMLLDPDTRTIALPPGAEWTNAEGGTA